MIKVYLRRNFRNLGFERQTIFFAHLGTLFLCFFPWFVADLKYGAAVSYTAFEGAHFLIGFFIFLFSLILSLLFFDRLMEKRKIKLGIPETWLYFGVGFQQVFLLILSWSVLTQYDYMESEIRFGLFFAFILQISGLVATFLLKQLELSEINAKNSKETAGRDNSLFN